MSEQYAQITAIMAITITITIINITPCVCDTGLTPGETGGPSRDQLLVSGLWPAQSAVSSPVVRRPGTAETSTIAVIRGSASLSIQRDRDRGSDEAGSGERRGEQCDQCVVVSGQGMRLWQ